MKEADTKKDLVNNEEPSVNNNFSKIDEVTEIKSYSNLKTSVYSFIRKIFHQNKSLNNKNFFEFCFNKYCRKDELIMTIIVISSIIFYILGLAKCDADPSECTIKRGMKFYFMIGTCSAISAVLYSTFITLSIYRRKYLLNYIYSIPIYIYYMATDTGTNTVHHGFYNAFGWWVISLVYIPILLFILIIRNLYKKKKFRTILLILGIIFIISLIYYNYPGFTCDYWDLGLNNTRIYNDKNIYPCKIIHPGKNK